MKTAAVIKNEGMRVLINNLGLLETEQFIMLIQKEPFDYTEWQKDLFEDMSVEEISKKAADYRKTLKQQTNLG